MGAVGRKHRIQKQKHFAQWGRVVEDPKSTRNTPYGWEMDGNQNTIWRNTWGGFCGLEISKKRQSNGALGEREKKLWVPYANGEPIEIYPMIVAGRKNRNTKIKAFCAMGRVLGFQIDTEEEAWVGAGRKSKYPRYERYGENSAVWRNSKK